MISRGSGHVHMVGVCGIGMAGVAHLLKKRGFTVSGCDAGLNRQAEWLTGSGISVDSPQSTGHIDGSVDWVVMTPALRGTQSAAVGDSRFTPRGGAAGVVGRA